MSAESPTGYDNLFADFHDAVSLFLWVKRLHRANLDGGYLVAFQLDLVDLGVAHQVEVTMVPPILVHAVQFDRIDIPHGGMDISVSGVTSTTSVSIDPLQPMFGVVASYQVLKVICDGDVLRFGSAKEVWGSWVGIVAEGDFDWALKPMDITIVTNSLVCSMLLHQREKFISSPAFGLNVIIVRG